MAQNRARHGRLPPERACAALSAGHTAETRMMLVSATASAFLVPLLAPGSPETVVSTTRAGPQEYPQDRAGRRRGICQESPGSRGCPEDPARYSRAASIAQRPATAPNAP